MYRRIAALAVGAGLVVALAAAAQAYSAVTTRFAVGNCQTLIDGINDDDDWLTWHDGLWFTGGGVGLAICPIDTGYYQQNITDLHKVIVYTKDNRTDARNEMRVCTTHNTTGSYSCGSTSYTSTSSTGSYATAVALPTGYIDAVHWTAHVRVLLHDKSGSKIAAVRAYKVYFN